VEPRWFRIFIYIAGACRLVNLRRLGIAASRGRRRRCTLCHLETLFSGLYSLRVLNWLFFPASLRGSLRRVVQSFASGLLTDG
jgi:hypothetical protein